jgi:hypothetical protein
MQALPAIGSAVGFVGFVAVLGGSIEWIRFTSAGLPVTQAVGAIVQRELVIVGATALIGFIALALAAVLVAYLTDSKGVGTRKLGRATVGLAMAEMAAAVVYTPASAGERIVFVAALIAVAGAILIALSPVLAAEIKTAVRTVEVSAWTLTVIVMGGVGAALLIWAVISSTKWLLLMLAVVIAVNAAVFGVARATTKFLWYGVSVFVSAPIFGAILSGIRTYRFPKVQPVALIRKASNHAICGIYIGESGERVYIGRVQLDARDQPIAGTGRIFWVPKSEVDMVKVGASQSIGDANGRGPELARELYADRGEAAPGQIKPTTIQTIVKHRNKTTTTTRETAVRQPPPTSKARAPKGLNSCTHENLEQPLKESREGWTKDP